MNSELQFENLEQNDRSLRFGPIILAASTAMNEKAMKAANEVENNMSVKLKANGKAKTVTGSEKF